MYFKLYRSPQEAKLSRYWRFFFLFFGINAFVGFITHGFKSYFTEQQFYYVFLTMNLASVPITFSLMKANVENTNLKTDTKKNFNVVIFIASAIFVAITIMSNTFVVVKISALISILLTIIVYTATYRKGFAGHGYIVCGFAVSISALVVHGAKLSFSDWFNFKDISHVIMIISLILIFMGIDRYLRSGFVRKAIPGK